MLYVNNVHRIPPQQEKKHNHGFSLILTQKRMHSSRMRTGCCRRYTGVGLCDPLKHTRLDKHPMDREHPTRTETPSPCLQTNTCENITLANTSYNTQNYY